MKEWKKEWMNEWTNERTNEWKNEWMNECMTEWLSEWMNERTNEWMNEGRKEWMNEAMIHWILPTSSSKCAPIATVLEHVQVQINLSLQSCELFVDHFCRSRPPYFSDHRSHFTRKTQGFAPECVFKPEITLSRPDDVVDMMTWWCGWHWHDGDNAGHDNRP